MAQTCEQFLEGRELRRFKLEARAVTRLDRQMDKADALIGELVREGKTVYYVVQCNGRVRESKNRWELFDFLVRNRYI
jgi:hypothetical protein